MPEQHREAARRRWQSPEYRAKQQSGHRSPLTLDQRIRVLILPPEPNGCRRWRGPHGRNGYARFFVRRDGRTVGLLVHRYIYSRDVGPIPDGWTVDHVWERGCRFRDCCEPSHLETVTIGDNIRRARAVSNPDACPKGHPFTPANTYRSKGHGRRCLECTRQQARKYQRARRAAARGS